MSWGYSHDLRVQRPGLLLFLSVLVIVAGFRQLTYYGRLLSGVYTQTHYGLHRNEYREKRGLLGLYPYRYMSASIHGGRGRVHREYTVGSRL